MTEHERGVERVIEKRKALGFGTHRPTGVQHDEQTLLRLGLELTHGELTTSRRRTPIDVPHFVVARELTQALELTLAAARTRRTRHALEALTRPRIVLTHCEHVGIHAYFGTR